MTLKEVIIRSATINEDLVLFAKRINDRLLPSCEAVLLELTDEEREMKTDEIAKRKCPGFSYCMEMFLIQEIMQDLDKQLSKNEIDKIIERLIYYIEYNA